MKKFEKILKESIPFLEDEEVLEFVDKAIHDIDILHLEDEKKTLLQMMATVLTMIEYVESEIKERDSAPLDSEEEMYKAEELKGDAKRNEE